MRNLSKRAFLEVSYVNEAGTGLGPTLEFYNLVAEEMRKRPGLWRKMEDNSLFPAPLKLSETSKEDIQRVYEFFKLAGAIVAKSIVDDKLIDLPFSSLFWDIVLGKVSPIT